MVLLYICISWTVGVYAGHVLYGSGIHIRPIFAVVFLGIAIVSLVFPRKRRTIIVMAWCVLAAVGGACRYQSYQASFSADSLNPYQDDVIAIRGTIARDPEVRDRYTLLHVCCTEVNTNSQWQAAESNILVYAEKYPDFGKNRGFPYYRYGDVIELNGCLEQPPSFDDFDYRAYLADRHIYFMLYYPESTLISEAGGSPIYHLIFDLRTAMTRAIDASLHEPQCAMTQSILLGKRDMLPDRLQQDLASSGTMHLFAISGIHISIIAGLCTASSAWLLGRKRNLYLLFPFVVIWLYAMISGMHSSAIRSSIMSSIYLLAIATGRQNSTVNALGLTAAIMVAIQPSILGDIGFQLSFLAMSGIVLIAPHLQMLGCHLINAVKVNRQSIQPNSLIALFNSSLSITLGATLATMPALAYHFGRISLVSLPATLLALPVIPLAIISGAAVGITGTFSLALSRVIGCSTWTLMSYINETIRFFAHLPLASVQIESVSAIYVCIAYLLIALTLLIVACRKRITIKGKSNE